MSSQTSAKLKRKSSTAFSTTFAKKRSGRAFTPLSVDGGRDIGEGEFGHNFSNIQVERDQYFKQSCPFRLSGPSHCPFGGVCHTCPPRIQTKLTIGQPGDKYEQEADRVADMVMHMVEPNVRGKGFLFSRDMDEQEHQIQAKSVVGGITPLVQRQVEEEEEEEEEEYIQTKEISNSFPKVTCNIESFIHSMKGGGQTIPESDRSYFESLLGQDFNRVRIHTGQYAEMATRSVNSRAFAFGNDLVFGRGQYSPGSARGRRLLAHELTHVMQQSSGVSGIGTRVQRKANGAAKPAKEIEPAQRTTKAERSSVPELIVDESETELAPGQMKKEDFLRILQPEVCRAAEEVLAPTGRSTKDCPYLEIVFKFFAKSSAMYIDQTLRQFAPKGSNIGSAIEYIPIITQRVRQSTALWVKTGKITGLPEGVPTNLLKTALQAAPEEGSSESENVAFKGRRGGPKLTRHPRAIKSQLGSGRPLEGSVRLRMAAVYGHDISQARIHTDSNAASLSSRFNARAFTVGNHIAFGEGEYQPGTLIGDALIAHELAHVAQQKSANSATSLKKAEDTGYDNALEDDADLAAVSALASLWSGAKASLGGLVQKAMPRLKTGLRLQSCRRTVKKCPPGKTWQVQTRLGEPLAVGTGPVCWCVWKCRPAPAPPPPPGSISCATDPRTGRSLCPSPPPVEEKDWPEQRRKAEEQPSWKLGPGGHFTPLEGQAMCGCLPLDVEGGEETGAPLIKVGIQATDLSGMRGRRRRDPRTGLQSRGTKTRRPSTTKRAKPAATAPPPAKSPVVVSPKGRITNPKNNRELIFENGLYKYKKNRKGTGKGGVCPECNPRYYELKGGRWRRKSGVKLPSEVKGPKQVSFAAIKDKKAVPVDPKVPATKLGLDKNQLSKFGKYLNSNASVKRVAQKKTLDGIKGQLAEEVVNTIGAREAASTQPRTKGATVRFFRGDEVTAPAPKQKTKGAESAPITDGVIAEITQQGNKAKLHIHRIYEVKAGEPSGRGLAKQVEWDIERIKEVGISVKVPKPDGGYTWQKFDPSDITMRPRLEQGEVFQGFTPSGVTPTESKSPTQKFTHRQLPGITESDLKEAALMVQRTKQGGQ